MNHDTLFTLRTDNFNLVRAVESRGKHVLDPVIAKGKREGDTTGWPVARDYIDRYISSATEIIDECFDVNGRDSLEDKSRTRHKGRKVDSGISFGTAERPSTSSSGTSHSRVFNNKPLPPSPTSKDRKEHRDSKESKSSGSSTLERIAKEIKKMRSRADIGGVPEPAKPSTSKNRSLKKMKSTGILTDRLKKPVTTSESGFDSAEFMRHKRTWEANNPDKLNAINNLKNP